VAAYEVLTATSAVRNLIKEGKTNQIRNVVSTHQSEGMQTLEASLSSLVAAGDVELETARLVSLYPKEIAFRRLRRRRRTTLPRRPGGSAGARVVAKWHLRSGAAADPSSRTGPSPASSRAPEGGSPSVPDSWASPAHPEEPQVFSTFADLLDYRPTFEVIAIHCHLSFPEEDTQGGRTCDKQARQLLGWPRSGAIGSPPSRHYLSTVTWRPARRRASTRSTPA
jgi:hypothetical protein